MTFVPTIRRWFVPAKNIYHDVVIDALKADGWTITHDPFPLPFGERKLYIDLGVERETLAAEKGTRRIAVEIQSFIGPSPVRLLQEAIGQYNVYELFLRLNSEDRELYMAVPKSVDDTLFSERFGRAVVEGLGLRVMVFNPTKKEIVRWIEPTDTAKS
jgi:hypothetical protein